MQYRIDFESLNHLVFVITIFSLVILITFLHQRVLIKLQNMQPSFILSSGLCFLLLLFPTNFVMLLKSVSPVNQFSQIWLHTIDESGVKNTRLLLHWRLPPTGTYHKHLPNSWIFILFLKIWQIWITWIIFAKICTFLKRERERGMLDASTKCWVFEEVEGPICTTYVLSYSHSQSFCVLRSVVEV